MNHLREVTNYIETMKIKKTFFGGYDREDVYAKLDTIVTLFEKCLQDYDEQEKALIEDYEKRMHASELLVAELNKKINLLTEEQQNALKLQQEAIEEKQKMKEAYREYCGDILKQYSDSLRLLSNEFTRILDNVSNMRKEIVSEEVFEGLERAFEMKVPEGITCEAAEKDIFEEEK